MRKVFLSLREKMASFARRYPCGVMACGVICVLLSLFLFEGYCFPRMLFPAVCLLLAGCVFSLPDAVWKFALPGLFVWGSFLIYQEKMENDPVKLFAGNRERTGIIAAVRVEDASLSGEGKLLPNPGRIYSKLLLGAYSPAQRMTEINGRILLKLPENFSSPLSYGDILLVEGQLARPSSTLLPGAFDYRSWLEKRYVHYILHAYKVEKSSATSSFTGGLLEWRNHFAEKVFCFLPEKNRSFAAALLFGCAQNVEKKTKSDLIRTGTIHILTVSGLHIGFFAAFVTLLCIGIPFKIRMVIIPLLTFFYAWMTGMNMPALRALLMLSVYCFARGAFLNSSAVNSLFFAFVLLMILHPVQFTDAGMHFSFLTTFALLLAVENIALWGKLLHEKYSFVPDRFLSWKKRYILRKRYTFFQIFAGCCAAWGASSILTLFYQGLITPFSVMVNFLFVPLVWLCFPVFFLGAVLGCLFAPAGKIGAYVLEVLTELLLTIPKIAAGNTDWVLPRPDGVSVSIFLLCFFILLWDKKRAFLTLSVAAMLIGMSFCFAGKLFPPPPEILVITGGGEDRICIMASIPEYEYAFLMDAADFETVMAASSYLRARGHKKINTLVSGSVRSRDVGSLKYLFSTLKIPLLIMPESSRHARIAGELRRKVAAEKGVNRTFENEDDPFTSFRFSSRELKEAVIECFQYKIYMNFEEDHIKLFRENKGRKKELLASIPKKNTMEENVYIFPL